MRTRLDGLVTIAIEQQGTWVPLKISRHKNLKFFIFLHISLLLLENLGQTVARGAQNCDVGQERLCVIVVVWKDCNVKADVSPLEKREKRNTKYCHLNATFSSRHQHLVIISNNKETWLKYWLDLPANKEARRFASLIFHPSQLWNKKRQIN